jgi:hypothetical protein
LQRALRRLGPFWTDQNLTRDDTSDQTPRDLHDRSIVGSGQTDDIALFPRPEQLDLRRERGILGDIQTELADRRHSIRRDQDLGHAGSPTTELLG